MGRKGGNRRAKSTSVDRRRTRSKSSGRQPQTRRSGSLDSPRKKPETKARHPTTKQPKNSANKTNVKPSSSAGGGGRKKKKSRSGRGIKKRALRLWNPEQEKRKRRVIVVLVTLIVLAGVSVLIWALTGRPSKDEVLERLSNFDKVLKDFNTTDFVNGWGEDPFWSNNNGVGLFGGGNDNNGPMRWKLPEPNTNNNDGKLQLQIWNALDDNWQSVFNTVIQEWNSGTPDVLDLQVQVKNVDRKCTPVNGFMKVCNANYGKTGWLGINEFQLDSNNYIVWSVAKMNEYYLLNADQDTRQYTLCHEVGHGFGLFHTDEDFNNADLGNCLDYSFRPENNLHPGTINFEKLQELYSNADNNINRGRRHSRHLRGQTDSSYNVTIVLPVPTNI